MPVPDSSNHRSLTLLNGLRVVLHSAPRLKRCAAALRVAAGSHDVPEHWPGLAHFLEHLFFLGTERFPAEQNLMTYVQRHGGQVNASTRERITDFFFELAPPVFAGGLDRLCEMLAHPRMSMADQLREREVLHAEFIAWARDAASRDQLKRLQPISPLHPLRWFHAGNRFSLPVPRPAFQQALQDFYRRFYQAGQMTLSLAGPQSLDELQVMATHFGGYFPAGSRADQVKPPPLIDNRVEPPTENTPHLSHLIFACEELPEGHEQAAAFLCTWINNAQSGGLVAELRHRGLIGSLKMKVLYEFAGQALLDIAIVPDDHAAQVAAFVFDWLAFFKTRYRHLLTEYSLLEQRGIAVSGALALARHFSAETINEPGVPASALRALDALLDRLIPQTLLRPVPGISAHPPTNIEWRLPEPNPFLRPSSEPVTHVQPLPAFTFSNALAANGEATVYLRWTLSTPQPKLALMLNDSLKALTDDAQQAGVAMTFNAYGNFWQLKLSGLTEPMPAVLQQALRQLSQPDEQALSRYGQPSHEPAPMPIRQLLKTLPDHYLNSDAASETDDLQSVWASARWIGFASGLDGLNQNALAQAMALIPGTPDAKPISPPIQAPGKRWRTDASAGSEDAVLMFYPAPSTLVEDEAIWRLFAHLVQAPFYQRLRVELQLGYAVFSGFRQIAGQSGLLFGVQSPNASAVQLVEHIEAFIGTLPALIERSDIPAQISAVENQLNPTVMESQQAAEMLWQAHLAGHPANYPQRLQHSFAHLQKVDLERAASRVALSRTSIFCLSNRASPSASVPVAE
jgi:coenzyme PQQ biosynthesis probable peptidase PqqF